MKGYVRIPAQSRCVLSTFGARLDYCRTSKLCFTLNQVPRCSVVDCCILQNGRHCWANFACALPRVASCVSSILCSAFKSEAQVFYCHLSKKVRVLESPGLMFLIPFGMGHIFSFSFLLWAPKVFEQTVFEGPSPFTPLAEKKIVGAVLWKHLTCDILHVIRVVIACLILFGAMLCLGKVLVTKAFMYFAGGVFCDIPFLLPMAREVMIHVRAFFVGLPYSTRDHIQRSVLCV